MRTFACRRAWQSCLGLRQWYVEAGVNKEHFANPKVTLQPADFFYHVSSWPYTPVFAALLALPVLRRIVVWRQLVDNANAKARLVITLQVEKVQTRWCLKVFCEVRFLHHGTAVFTVDQAGKGGIRCAAVQAVNELCE